MAAEHDERGVRTDKPLTSAVSIVAVVCLLLVGSTTAGAMNPQPSGGYNLHSHPSTMLPSGYLSTSGSQIIGSRPTPAPSGKPVRISAIGWFGQNGLNSNEPVGVTGPLRGIQANVNAMKAAGFNTITIGWNDASLHSGDASAYLEGIDRVVDAAGHVGMKVILNHHVDEGLQGNGNCLAQQANGLWYDSGPGTDGTDGCGNPGTVTQATFLSDWEVFARRYSGNSTVIGFDLDNEPLAYPGMSTWGDGGITDIREMYSEVGSALEELDPGVLIICEGPQNYNGTFAGPEGVTSPEGDLTLAQDQPVTLTVDGHAVTDKVVYSVHEYPSEISGITQDSGPEAIARYNAVWGYLIIGDIAPVWIGEAGSSMQNNPDDTAWANTLTSYLNGQ